MQEALLTGSTNQAVQVTVATDGIGIHQLFSFFALPVQVQLNVLGTTTLGAGTERLGTRWALSVVLEDKSAASQNRETIAIQKPFATC